MKGELATRQVIVLHVGRLCQLSFRNLSPVLLHFDVGQAADEDDEDEEAEAQADYESETASQHAAANSAAGFATALGRQCRNL